MSLAATGSISLSSILGIDNVPGAQQIVTSSQSGSNSLIKVFDLTTFAQVGSTITVSSNTSNGGICMLNSNVLFVPNFNNTTQSMVNLSTGVVSSIGSTNIGSSSSLYSQQLLAAIPSLNLGYCIVVGSSNQIYKLDPTAISATAMTVNWLVGDTPTAIINKGTSGFIIGTQRGRIIEVDTALNVVNSYRISYNPDDLIFGINTNDTLYAHVIVNMSYYSGYLLVTTGWGHVILMEHDSGIELQRQTAWSDGTTFKGTRIANSGYQETIMAGANSSSGGTTLTQFDFCLTPMLQKSHIFGNSFDTGSTQWLGLNTAGSTPIVWFAPNSSTIINVATMAGARSVNTHAISCNGNDGEATIYDDAGAGTMSVMFRTTIPAAGKSAVPFTAGRNTVVVRSYGNGIIESNNISRINPS